MLISSSPSSSAEYQSAFIWSSLSVLREKPKPDGSIVVRLRTISTNSRHSIEPELSRSYLNHSLPTERCAGSGSCSSAAHMPRKKSASNAWSATSRRPVPSSGGPRVGSARVRRKRALCESLLASFSAAMSFARSVFMRSTCRVERGAAIPPRGEPARGEARSSAATTSSSSSGCSSADASAAASQRRMKMRKSFMPMPDSSVGGAALLRDVSSPPPSCAARTALAKQSRHSALTSPSEIAPVPIARPGGSAAWRLRTIARKMGQSMRPSWPSPPLSTEFHHSLANVRLLLSNVSHAAAIATYSIASSRAGASGACAAESATDPASPALPAFAPSPPPDVRIDCWRSFSNMGEEKRKEPFELREVPWRASSASRFCAACCARSCAALVDMPSGAWSPKLLLLRTLSTSGADARRGAAAMSSSVSGVMFAAVGDDALGGGVAGSSASACTRFTSASRVPPPSRENWMATAVPGTPRNMSAASSAVRGAPPALAVSCASSIASSTSPARRPAASAAPP